jgi:hypothetical protein
LVPLRDSATRSGSFESGERERTESLAKPERVARANRVTDNQFYILITVIGAGLAGIGAAIRFSVGRVVGALDLNSSTMLENTKSNAVLSTKIDAIGSYVQGRSRVSSEVKEFVAVAIRDEISGVHDAVKSTSPSSNDDDTTPREGPPKRAPSIGGGEYGPTKRKGGY